jgi:hypothetical protein
MATESKARFTSKEFLWISSDRNKKDTQLIIFILKKKAWSTSVKDISSD